MDDLFQVLSDSRRRDILRQLATGERSAGEVHEKQAEVTFGAVSQHLKVLERAGLVSSRKAGRNRFYQANLEALLPLRQWLDWMWDQSLDRLKQLAESESSFHHEGTKTQTKRKQIKRKQSSKVEMTDERQLRKQSGRSGKISGRARHPDRGAS